MLGMLILLTIFILVFMYRLYAKGQESKSMKIELGIKNGLFVSCPNKANCVNSQEDEKNKKHFIEPYYTTLSLEEFLSQFEKVISGISNASLVEKQSNYMHLEFTSTLFGFVDDFEIFIPQPFAGKIHVRSASRVGYSDMGANRSRVEEIRKLLE